MEAKIDQRPSRESSAPGAKVLSSGDRCYPCLHEAVAEENVCEAAIAPLETSQEPLEAFKL
jgi:hypothetical protein